MDTALDKIDSEEAKIKKLITDGEGAYCYRQDTDGNATHFAYIMLKLRLLIIIENIEEPEPDVFIMNKAKGYEVWNKNKIAICNFLGELFFRTRLQQGTEYEQKMSQGQWQICKPQSIVPEKIVSLVNELLKDKQYGTKENTTDKV